MSGILRDVEYAIMEFVKTRIDEEEWKDLTCPNDILRRMHNDDEEEMKDFIWNKIQHELSWKAILDDIQELVDQQELDKEDEENIYNDSTETEDEDDD